MTVWRILTFWMGLKSRSTNASFMACKTSHPSVTCSPVQSHASRYTCQPGFCKTRLAKCSLDAHQKHSAVGSVASKHHRTRVYLSKNGVLVVKAIKVYSCCDIELRCIQVLSSSCHAKHALSSVPQLRPNLAVEKSCLLPIKNTACMRAIIV